MQQIEPGLRYRRLRAANSVEPANSVKPTKLSGRQRTLSDIALRLAPVEHLNVYLTQRNSVLQQVLRSVRSLVKIIAAQARTPPMGRIYLPTTRLFCVADLDL